MPRIYADCLPCGIDYMERMRLMYEG